ADGDKEKAETIRRRLNKYRPPKGGGAAAVKPTEPTRREIEKAMGLEQDALAPEQDAVAAKTDAEFLKALAPLRRLYELDAAIARGDIRIVRESTAECCAELNVVIGLRRKRGGAQANKAERAVALEKHYPGHELAELLGLD